MKLTNSTRNSNKKPDEWQGYTLEQIAYERAVALARIEIQKNRMDTGTQRMRAGNFSLGSAMFSKILSALSYVDYAVIAIQLYRRIAPLFRKKS